MVAAAVANERPFWETGRFQPILREVGEAGRFTFTIKWKNKIKHYIKRKKFTKFVKWITRDVMLPN